MPSLIPSPVRRIVWGALVATLAAAPASSQFVATQVDVANAPTLLFGGSDADGGIDDWYLTNGVIELVVDDVAPQPDLVPLLGAAAPPKGHEAAISGGSIIDLGLVGQDNDQLNQIFTVGGLSTSNFIAYDTIGASTTATSASITVSGVLQGFDASGVPETDLPLTTTYTLNGSDDFVTVHTVVTNLNPTNTASLLGGFLDVFLWVSRGVTPFTPLTARGFNHVELDLGNPASALELPVYMAGAGRLGPDDGVMDSVTGTAIGSVSYGVLGESAFIDPAGGGGTPAAVNRLFGINGQSVSALGNFPIGSLAPGESLHYTRRVYVAGDDDVAGVTNAMISELGARLGFATGTISGDIDGIESDDVRASVIATRTAGPAIAGLPLGAPVSQRRTDASGGFGSWTLPVGTYSLEVRAPERDVVTVGGVVVSAATDTVASIPDLSALGALVIEARERVQGPDPSLAARATIIGIDGTPDPRFQYEFEALELPAGAGAPNDTRPETFGRGPHIGNVAYFEGATTVDLRPGRYEVVVSRGLEYTVARRRVTVREPRILSDGSVVPRPRRVRARLRRMVDTPDALSADFHIHSGRSFDSSAPLEDRVLTFAGEGIEVMVSTDHDFVTDYAPIISSLALPVGITSIVGEEVTGTNQNPPTFPDSVGHLNAWPLPVQPDERYDGGIQDEFVAPNMIYSRLRALGAQLIQYNHPRAGVSGITSIGLFTNVGYDPDLPITAAPNDLLLSTDVLGQSGVANPDGFRNLDFDLMEIINGTSFGSFLEVRRDWFSLLNQVDFLGGPSSVPFIVGTAVSDSHRLTLETAGFGRSYVLGVGDDTATLSEPTFHAQTGAGRLLATTGPYVELTLEDGSGATAALGDYFVPSSPDVTLHIKVQAANWVQVPQVRIVQNGFTTHTFTTASNPAVRLGPRFPWAGTQNRKIRFEESIPITLGADTWLLVEAGESISVSPTPDPFVEKIVPGFNSLAFTNPIFVDLGGDGFTPPGLPVEVPGALSRSLVARSSASTGSWFDGLTAEEQEELRDHLPVHLIAIPQAAVEALRP